MYTHSDIHLCCTHSNKNKYTLTSKQVERLNRRIEQEPNTPTTTKKASEQASKPAKKRKKRVREENKRERETESIQRAHENCVRKTLRTNFTFTRVRSENENRHCSFNVLRACIKFYCKAKKKKHRKKTLSIYSLVSILIFF